MEPKILHKLNCVWLGCYVRQSDSCGEKRAAVACLPDAQETFLADVIELSCNIQTIM